MDRTNVIHYKNNLVGLDNYMAGAQTFISGKSQPTLLFSAAKGAGFSDNAAMVVEFGANLGPTAVFGMTKEVTKVVAKGCVRNNFVSSSKPRVDTSRLPNTSSSLSSSSSINTKVHIPDDKVGHIFRNHSGHIPYTLENRKLLIDVANDISSRRGIDQHGNAWYSQIIDDGSQVWVQVGGNKITNGGINNPPKVWNKNTGYSATHKFPQGPKNK